MGARKLSVVPDPPDEPAQYAPPQTVKSAAASSTRELLVALRDRIAGDIDEGVPARDLAALSNRLLQIAEQIAKLDAEEKGDDVGDAAETPDEAWSDT